MTKYIALGKETKRPGLFRTVIQNAKVAKQLALSPEAREAHRAERKLAIDDEKEEEEEEVRKEKTLGQRQLIVFSALAGGVICLPLTMVAGMIITPVVAIHMANKGFFRPGNQHALMVDLHDDTENCAAYLMTDHLNSRQIQLVKSCAAKELKRDTLGMSKAQAVIGNTLCAPLWVVCGAINAPVFAHCAVTDYYLRR